MNRRPGESVIVELPTGEQVEITILGVGRNHVRLGTMRRTIFWC